MGKPDYIKLRPNFGFAPIDRIKHTLSNTTQYARMDTRLPLRKHFKSRFPAANIPRLNETVATDTLFSNTPAHNDGILGHAGATMVQLYCGKSSQLTAVYPMKSDHEMSHTLEDFIRHHGAPNALFSDNAKAQIGKAVLNILRMYSIKDFQCEPHHQHQNYAERRIQEVKKHTNELMDRTNTPPSYWLLCTIYTVYILNRLSTASLGHKTPIEVATGQQPDISALLAFYWYEPVYFKDPNKHFPSQSNESAGRIVGIATHQGDSLTFLVMDDTTLQVMARSELRSALDPLNPNLRANPNAPTGIPILRNSTDLTNIPIDPTLLKLPSFSPDELLGKTFTRTYEPGDSYKATVIKRINDAHATNQHDVKFLLDIGDGAFDELISYHALSQLITDHQALQAHDTDHPWTFTSILEHQGPLLPSNTNYKGSAYNLLVKWDDDSETYEPFDLIYQDDPVTLSLYAQEHDLLDTPGWKRLKRFLPTNPTSISIHTTITHRPQQDPTYQFGIEVPRTVKQAYALDLKNNNSKWSDAIAEEISSLHSYNTFKDHGKITYLPDYKRIIVHFVFAVKHDLRHKARLVAGGHLTDSSIDGTYSGVVSLRSLRIAILAAELNQLQIMVGDISSAYLEAYTQERVCFLAGPEFGPLQGHLLVIERALYGLRTSGARWHDRFSDTLRDMSFTPCEADPDVWMRPTDTHYEYVCVYVDDIMMFGKDPQSFFTLLTEKYNYQLKGVGPPKYHLGGDFFRDKDGTLAWGAASYAKKILNTFEATFGHKAHDASSPLPEKDHPELDTSDLLTPKDIKLYQSLIGALQWLVTLGRFDILVHVATMGSFRVAPRIGHLERLKRIFGYIKKYPDGAIRFRPNIPLHEHFCNIPTYDWSQTIYGTSPEELPPNMPPPLGLPVRTTTYCDANLMHDLLTGRSMSGIITLLNQTPIQWFAKKQATVETATYGSEFLVARQATEQILDLRYTLRMMGIPLDGPSWLFGDNSSVITSSTIPHSTLNRRHTALSYHRVRESIASKVIHFLHVSGVHNPSDVLTKFLGYTKLCPLIQPLLFWKGETLKYETKPIPHIIHDLQLSSPSGLRGVTDDSNPYGSEISESAITPENIEITTIPSNVDSDNQITPYGIPSNATFLEYVQNPSNPIPELLDISQAYTYGQITENLTNNGNNNTISETTLNEYNEQRELSDNQDSNSNHNYILHYGHNSMASPSNSTIK